MMRGETDRKQAMTDLLVKVEAGEYAPQAMRVRAGLKDSSVAAFTLAFDGSLDAAQALHEAVLPGVEWPEITDVDQRPSGNPARAWLIAILKALITKDET